MSMKKIVVALLVLILGLSMVSGSGCAGPAKEPTGGTLTIAMTDLWGQVLDPAEGMGRSKGIKDFMYDYLIGANRDTTKLDTTTGIVNKWEHSPDYMTWTFYIREGIKFHNGDPLTAEDVKFSLDRILAPGCKALNAGDIQSRIARVEVAGPYKVVIHAKKPTFTTPYFLSDFGCYEALIVPKNYFQKVGEKEFKLRPVGSGPYRLVENVVGDHLTFEAVDNHWLLGKPRFKTLIFKLVPEETTRIAMLKTGEADIIDISRKNCPELEKLGFNIFSKKNADLLLFYVHQQWQTQNNPLSNKKVRQALSMALDREKMVKELLAGYGETRPSPMVGIGSYALGYEKKPVTRYDPEQAKKLLAEAGYPNGLDLNFYTYTLPAVPEAPALQAAAASYWGAIGIRAKMIPVDYPTFRSKIPAGTLDNPAVSGPMHSGQRFIASPRTNLHSKGSLSLSHDPELDKLVEKFEGAVSEEEYIRLLKDITRYVEENHYGALYFAEVNSTYAASKKVKDWNLGKLNYVGINLRDVAWVR